MTVYTGYINFQYVAMYKLNNNQTDWCRLSKNAS